MSALKEKTPVITTTEIVDESPSTNLNVLTITRPSPARQGSAANIAVMSTIHDIDSTHSISPTPSVRQEKSMDGGLSPFYNPSGADSKANMNVTQTSFDLEAQGLTTQKTECSGRSGLLSKNKSRCDPAWPDRQELKTRRKAAKRARAQCAMWARMSKTKRGVITTIIVLVFLGAAIGIGFGISQRVGGGAYSNHGSNTPISHRK